MIKIKCTNYNVQINKFIKKAFNDENVDYKIGNNKINA